MTTRTFLAAAIATTSISALTTPGSARAAIFNNNWQTTFTVTTFQDDRTDDNQSAANGWNIDPGADIFAGEKFERPTAQGFKNVSGTPYFDKYYEALDILSGKFALDTVNQHAYFSIDLQGDDLRTFSSGTITESDDKFSYFYRMRIANNADFDFGYMFGVKDPEGNGLNNVFNNPDDDKTTQLWRDTSTGGSVTGPGGLAVTGEGGIGYETQVFSEGGSNDDLQARIVGSSIELAIAYGANDLNIPVSVFSFLIFEANKGLSDPGNYFWNDEYNAAQAGSPYSIANPQNIYELDTLVAAVPVVSAAVPEPYSIAVWSLLALTALGLAYVRR